MAQRTAALLAALLLPVGFGMSVWNRRMFSACMRGSQRTFSRGRLLARRVQGPLLARPVCRIGLAFSRDRCVIGRWWAMRLVDGRRPSSWWFSARPSGHRERHGGLSAFGDSGRQGRLRASLSQYRRGLRRHRGRRPRSLGGSECGGLMTRHERRDRLRAGRTKASNTSPSTTSATTCLTPPTATAT